MKVRESEFIKRKKPVLKKLIERLSEQYPYVSLLATDSKAKSYMVSRRNTAISENGVLAARGFVAKISDGKHYAEYSFSRISEVLLDEICAQIAETIALSKNAVPEGMTENEYAFPEDEKTAFTGSTEYEIDPEEMGDDVILEHLTKIKDRGLAVSDQILDCSVRCNYQK